MPKWAECWSWWQRKPQIDIGLQNRKGKHTQTDIHSMNISLRFKGEEKTQTCTRRSFPWNLSRFIAKLPGNVGMNKVPYVVDSIAFNSRKCMRTCVNVHIFPWERFSGRENFPNYLNEKFTYKRMHIKEWRENSISSSSHKHYSQVSSNSQLESSQLCSISLNQF